MQNGLSCELSFVVQQKMSSLRIGLTVVLFLSFVM